jgi:hypothetical protein
LSEPKPGEENERGNPSGTQWWGYAITLLLLLVLVVTGSAAYYAREQWWERYLGFIHRLG